jgi:acyl-CoA synthetase (NDP forming)
VSPPEAYARLRRLLEPRTVAFVGLSDASPLGQFVAPTLSSDAKVAFVNPKHSSVLGHKTVPSLRDLDGPVDAVMTLVSSDRTVSIAEEMVGLDIGGLVAVASGFAEQGPEGAERQARLRRAAQAGGFPVVGPNGLGVINVPKRLSLTIAGAHKRRPGGISVVSHSGAVLSGVAMAAWENVGCGLNLLISAGNEVSTDLADYVDYLSRDPATTVIGLVIETIRRPAEFFAAVGAAIAAGKPVVALKLGRTPRTRRLALSHTAADAGDPWIYETALRQAGVETARDIEEFVDRLVIFDQLDRSRWTRVDRLAVVTMTGGFASLGYDLAVDEGLSVPVLDDLGKWAADRIPGVAMGNPLDATGLGGEHWPQIARQYARSDDVDALLMIHPLADEDAGHSPAPVSAYVAAASEVAKPVVISNCSGAPGAWVPELLSGAVVTSRGLRAGVRGLGSLGRFVRFRQALGARDTPSVASAPRPGGTPADIAAGVLRSAGVTVMEPSVPDRSTIGLGLWVGRSELGPAVIFDVRPGGDEDYAQRFGRMAPISATDAGELAQEIVAGGRACGALVTGTPGTPEAAALATLLVALGHLAAGAQAWLEYLSAASLAVAADGTWRAARVEVRLR